MVNNVDEFKYIIIASYVDLFLMQIVFKLGQCMCDMIYQEVDEC